MCIVWKRASRRAWLCGVLPAMAGLGSAAGYAVFCPLWQVREVRLAMRHSVRYGRFGECGWLCGALPVMAGKRDWLCGILSAMAGSRSVAELSTTPWMRQRLETPQAGKGGAVLCARRNAHGVGGEFAHGSWIVRGGGGFFAKIPSARGQARKMAKNEGASLRTDAARAKKGADRFQTTEMGG